MRYLKIMLFTIIFIILSQVEVNAADGYTEVDRRLLPYDINNFQIINDYIMINGWAVGR